MAKNGFHRELLASEDFAVYSLRSSFFVRRLRAIDLWKMISEVQKLATVKKGFPWTQRGVWGIEEEAWHRVTQWQIEPLTLFSHPRVLTEQPRLLLYYRTVALLSQKGLNSLVAPDVARIESGKVDHLRPEQVAEIVVAINSVISAMVSAGAELEASQLPGLQFAAAGATIQGSWNNAVGAEGEAAVRSILLNHLKERIVQIVWRDAATTEYSEQSHAELLDRVDDVRVVRLKQGFHLVFASEPDVSLRDAENVPIIAIEVKAGSDTAGALERLGAAMKSFENDRNINPELKTVYVVRAMTPELRKRIDEGNPFDFTFALSELLADDRTQKTFANLVVRAVVGKLRR